jgi:alkanesulfonate monooxygenase SsuD/methylene tetrahydromethanopterin reductase-like flavin-dependent oxidoreductase (luciferase family)
MTWSMRFDMRVPSFSETPRAEYYRGALDLARYADEHGCASLMVSEHHQSEDGYLSDALTMAASLAAVTANARLAVGALILSLHDPIRAAERTALVDVISNGRVDVVVGAGYVAREFAMFGYEVKDRARLVEKKLPVYLAALSGEPFEHAGSTVQISPGPVQRPRPTVILGGTAPAVARRAARLADGFNPIVPDSSLGDIYRDECAKLGKEPGVVVGGGDVQPVLFLAEDVDAEWERLAPYLMHEANMYGTWAAQAGTNEHLFRPVHDLADVRALGMHRVLTVDECVELALAGGAMTFHPMAGGVPPLLAWNNLRMFVERVLPEIDREASRP